MLFTDIENVMFEVVCGRAGGQRLEVDPGEEEGVAGDGLAGEGPERSPVRSRPEPSRGGGGS